ncbi:hypothetical protein SAMN05216315_11727 [Nitrosospira sp. Nsp18]|uniref:class I SAM-dependent methyltransferase n=1 Tax=Nitrosospira sp. Nsp18 TaxID=1855334 RepID=UPI0008843EB4|nr:class I SAM-dependent methyltransferase [Nitrosospira sp. Nsp18]SDA21865.1 hypothetical protein SAMN05216315_11727 [Nitrosospira sp. Nsp18]
MINERLKQRILSLQDDLGVEYHPNFRIEKKDLLDIAFDRNSPESIAELGCVWGIDCAYGRYALEKFRLKSVKMVDTHWTEPALEKVARHPEIEIFRGNFGELSMPETLGHVDAILLFDVLLHQVAPDWDRLLQIYAPYTKSFVIFNQQWVGSPLSIRLLDMGHEEYFRNVPHDPSHPPYQKLFDSMYEMHSDHNRIWRDVHHVWQWGITTADLLFTMDRLGFQLDYFKSYGKLNGLPNFSEQAFVFRKCHTNSRSKTT